MEAVMDFILNDFIIVAGVGMLVCLFLLPFCEIADKKR